MANTLVGIDIGSSKIMTIVAKIEGKNPPTILGYGISRSRGIDRGAIVDLGEAATCIEESVREAEKSSKFNIKSASISISDSSIESVNSHSSITVSKSPREINSSDSMRLEELIENKALKLDRHIIHRIPYNYRIDDGNVIKNPVGMIGSKLEADFHIVTGIVNSVESLIKCIEGIDISVDRIMFSSIAAAESVLTDTEKKIGSLLINMGAGTTEVSFIKNERLINTHVLPMGGDHFTHDIATILNVDLKTAEYLKRLREDREFVEISSYRSSKRVNLSYLQSIIDSRSDEILEHIYGVISNNLGNLRNGIVLTGGASNTINFKEKVEELFKVPVRIGVPNLDIVDELKVPDASVGIGLIMLPMAKTENVEHKFRIGFFRTLKDRIKSLFDSFVE